MVEGEGHLVLHLVLHREPLGLLRVVSGPLSALAGAVSGESSEEGVATEDLAAAFRDAAKAIAEEGPDTLLDELFRHTFRDGEPVVRIFDSAYQGNYGELVEALVFVLRHNFEKSLRRVPFGVALSKLPTPSSTAS